LKKAGKKKGAADSPCPPSTSPQNYFSAKHAPNRLKELLRQKLAESGWRDQLKEHCKVFARSPPPFAHPVAAQPSHPVLLPQNVLREKGLEAISVEELVKEITPRGRATVPDSLKAELLQRIRKFLAEN
jgi:enhancer of yellow 2 transcription factor